MKVIKLRNADVFDCVGTTSSRKKVVLRIANTNYGATNPLGFKFMPDDFRVLDDKGKGATDAQLEQLRELGNSINALEAKAEKIQQEIRALSTVRRNIIEKLPRIDVDKLPVLELMPRAESSKILHGELLGPRSVNSTFYNASQIVKLDGGQDAPSDQAKA